MDNKQKVENRYMVSYAEKKIWNEEHRDSFNASVLNYYHNHKDEINAKRRQRYREKREAERTDGIKSH